MNSAAWGGDAAEEAGDSGMKSELMEEVNNMPQGDGTGPQGQGPKTGKGRGRRNPKGGSMPAQGQRGTGSGRGQSRGSGQGRGKNRGTGQGRGRRS